MSKDIQGVGLGIASRFAGSEFAKKYGLRRPAEKLAYVSTKKGFEVIGQMMANKAKKKSDDPKMLPEPSTAGLFDLTLSEEQQMIKDTVRSYAEDVVRGLAHDANEDMDLPATWHGVISPWHTPRWLQLLLPTPLLNGVLRHRKKLCSQITWQQRR
ncbi:MAG: hypothetical protein VW274_00755 [Thalassolituus sp.]